MNKATATKGVAGLTGHEVDAGNRLVEKLAAAFEAWIKEEPDHKDGGAIIAYAVTTFYAQMLLTIGEAGNPGQSVKTALAYTREVTPVFIEGIAEDHDLAAKASTSH